MTFTDCFLNVSVTFESQTNRRSEPYRSSVIGIGHRSEMIFLF